MASYSRSKYRSTKGPLIICEKRWYFNLVSGVAGQEESATRSRALMDDYTLNDIANHLVICYTPSHLPGQARPFVNLNGQPRRIYAFFDSYIEFYKYFQHFEDAQKCFYEIVFGELPQKPHFDIDIDVQEFTERYPGDSVDSIATFLLEEVINGCQAVFEQLKVPVTLETDLLIYNSHGPNKRSFHVIWNNKCHDGHKEAKAFYDAVMTQVRNITPKYLEFVDKSVYSPRQQFRLIGSRKVGTSRVKRFHEEFEVGGRKYQHVYAEEFTDLELRKLAVLQESLVSFTAGCVYIPSLVLPKQYSQPNLGDLPDLSEKAVTDCISLVAQKFRERGLDAPFAFLGIRGHLILLRRLRRSLCPLCNKIHEHENPFLFIVSGKIYWDCRRTEGNKFFVGYLESSTPLEDVLEEEESEDDDSLVECNFGGYQMTLKPEPATSEPSSAPPPKRDTYSSLRSMIQHRSSEASRKNDPEALVGSGIFSRSGEIRIRDQQS